MSLSFTPLSLEDVFALSDRTIRLSTQDQVPTDISDNPIFTLVKVKFANFEKSYESPYFSGKGKDLVELNKLRRKLAVGFKTQLQGLANMQGLEKQQKAKELFVLVKPHLTYNATKAKYSDITAHLNKCIEELSTASNQQKLTSIGLIDSFNLLKETQQQFEQIYLEKTEIDADLRNKPNTSKLRKELVDALKDYYKLVDVMKHQKGWDKLYLALKELIKSVNTSAKISRAIEAENKEKAENKKLVSPTENTSKAKQPKSEKAKSEKAKPEKPISAKETKTETITKEETNNPKEKDGESNTINTSSS